MNVAALYVERGGPYLAMGDVDAWDKERDAHAWVAPPWIKFCSSAQRRRTPPAFARWLIDHVATAVPAWRLP